MLRGIWATITLLIMATLIFNPIGTTLADGPLLGGRRYRNFDSWRIPQGAPTTSPTGTAMVDR